MENVINILAKAFDGESQVRNRYTVYAEIAQKEGHNEISEVFLSIADNEKEHARWFLKMLDLLKSQNPNDINQVDINTFVIGRIGNTKENLETAIAGETLEFTKLYPELSLLAKNAGLDEIADRINAIGIAEKHHADRFKKLLSTLVPGENIIENIYNEKAWVCHQCGYIAIGDQSPSKCPSCDCTDCFYQAE